MEDKENKKIIISHGKIRELEEPDSLRESLKRLGKILKIKKLYFLLMILTVTLSSGINLVIPYMLGRAVDRLGRDISKIVVGLVLIYSFDMVLKISKEFLIIEISQRSIFKIREASFSKLQRLPIMYFDMEDNGDIMSRLSNDIEDIGTSISETLARLISSIIGLIGAVGMMVYLSPELTLASFITVPITYLFTRAVSRRTRRIFKARQETLGDLNSHIEESITGTSLVKAYNNQDLVVKEFKARNNRLRDLEIEAQILSGIMMPIMNVIKYLNFTILAVTGGYLAIRSRISVGVITSFISYSKQFSRPLNEIGTTYNTLQSGLAGMDRIFQILDEAEESPSPKGAIKQDNFKGGVEFRKVSFSYPGGEEVLKDISFNIGPGKSVALVGHTGAGKTTIVNLLTGLYQDYQGEILIDGVNILSYDKNSLRENFASVLQDTYLFTGTIMDNIRYGRLGASDREIIQAGKASTADEFISRLEDGYETVLTEGGRNLSQGERQLIAITRAIISRPSILILDEATSSVDTKTELKIQEAMVDFMKGKTSFIIAHRLSTIRDADLILVLAEGRIIEKGTHKDLIEENGYYKDLYMNQKINL